MSPRIARSLPPRPAAGWSSPLAGSQLSVDGVRFGRTYFRLSAVSPVNPVRIRLRYPDLDSFVEKFAPNVTRGGVFLASRNVQPVGSIIGFEILLVGGEVALAGQGKVSWLKEFNPAEPTRPYGMGVQFISIEPASKSVLGRILRAKEASGQAPRRSTGGSPVVGSAASSPNGKPSAPAIDTTVDLAAEYGLEDVAVRRVIDRSRMTGARGDDDLSDLLKPEPVEPATLAQALAELPRLLDANASRRRASGAFRLVDAPSLGGDRGAVVAVALALSPAAVVLPASSRADGLNAADFSETTNLTGTPGAGESNLGAATESETGQELNGRRGRKRRR